MKFYKKILVLLFGVFLILSCEKGEESCDECQAAIQHMCDKIKQNSCNPDYMQNAVNRIREDCGSAVGNIYVGYMAHTCNFEAVLDCGSCLIVDEKKSASHLSGTKAPYIVNIDKDVTDTLTIIVTKDKPHPNGDYIIIKSAVLPGDNIFEVSDGPQFNNSEVHVNVYEYDPDNNFDGTGDLLVSQKEIFKFYRPGNWDKDRIIDISIDPVFNDYRVDFEYW